MGGGGRGGWGRCEISRHGDGEIYTEKLINPLSGVTEVMLSGLPRILHRSFFAFWFHSAASALVSLVGGGTFCHGTIFSCLIEISWG